MSASVSNASSLPLVLYLHGFNSSPKSHKAELTRSWVAEQGLPVQLQVPALPYSPAAASQLIQRWVEQVGPHRVQGVIGSSLGGYYATWLAEKYGIPAALVNPAVRPYELLADYLGENRNLYTGEQYELTSEHMQELLALDVLQPSRPEQFFLLVQTGDLTLDYRQAVAKFSTSPAWIEGGGSHEFDDFTATLPAIFAFFRGNVAGRIVD